MQINVFEGARRIAFLLAAVVAIATVALTATSDPYVSLDYRVSSPTAPFVRTELPCPTGSGSSYFSARTTQEHSVGVDLCLLTMPFGDDGTQLVPYRIDEAGMVWGAASYSTEVLAYEHELERRFTFSPADEAWIASEVAKLKRENWVESLGSLAIGLAIYWALVWALGWIVRGFSGIPLGKDSRPGEA